MMHTHAGTPHQQILCPYELNVTFFMYFDSKLHLFLSKYSFVSFYLS